MGSQFNALMDHDGRINALGRQYIGLDPNAAPGLNGSIARDAWVSLRGLAWLVIWNIFLLVVNI